MRRPTAKITIADYLIVTAEREKSTPKRNKGRKKRGAE